MHDSWPSAEHDEQRSSPLPRVEDIPYVDRGHDPERVREAFDAFYRHIARLDATLRTIEAVDVFRDQAGELRKELRALRTAGWTQQPWLPSYSTRERAGAGVPEAVFRWAVEACFVIAVPVAAAVADLRSLWIVVAAAGAFAIVAVTEWVASREHGAFPAAAPAAAPPVPAPVAEEPPVALPPAEPAPVEATEWNLPPPVEEADLLSEPVQQEELTVVGEAEAAEAGAAEEAEEPEERPRLGFLRRREVEEAQAEADEPEPAELVEEPEAEVVADAEPEVGATAEPEPEPAAAAAEPEEPELAELLKEPEAEVVAEAEPEVTATAEPEPELSPREQEPEIVLDREPEPAVAAEPEEPELAELLKEPEAEVVAESEPEVTETAEPGPEPAPQPEEPVAEQEPTPPRRRLLSWRRRRVEEEEVEVDPDDTRPKHVRVLPPDVASRVEPLDPWEEELDAEPEPEAEHEPTHRG